MFDALNVRFHRIPPRREWPSDRAHVRSKFGQNVLWLDHTVEGGHHFSSDELERYRLVGDGSVDRILTLLDEMGSPLGPGDDLLEMMTARTTTTTARNEDDATPRSDVENEMSAFLRKHSTLPPWVDKEQLKRGQDVFLAYLPVATLSLYYRSLVAGFSIPKIAAVVRATAYLAPPSRPDQVLQRLLDTGELTTACIGLGLDALLPGGAGWRTALHVRFLHAKVRRALLKRRGEKRWNVEEYGIPINQEDMAGTLLAFSVNVLFGIDLIAGVSLSDRERLDYLALWRYIGFLLGVETEGEERTANVGRPAAFEDLPPLDPCGPGGGEHSRNNPVTRSNAILQSIIFHLMDPDESSVEIAHHLLKITDQRPPTMRMDKIPEDFYKNELFYYRSFNCRRMIGDPLADALDLPLHPKWWMRRKIWLKSTVILSFLRLYTVAAMWVPFARRWIIGRHRQAMTAFHESWLKRHKSKLARALATKEKASVLEQSTAEEEFYAENGGPDRGGTITAANTAAASICPFAMTAPPT
jgi:ER-bound oxygenase mpaB/B'/Rubber oxygenase, catalytic domain